MGDLSKARQPHDYVAFSGGSAGRVTASRFSEESTVSALLISEGGPTNRSWTINMPLVVELLLLDDKYHRAYESERHASINYRQIPRGRVLGGSSSVNGMVYSRCHALDYENWVQRHDCKAGSYAGVLPYFKKPRPVRATKTIIGAPKAQCS